MTFRKYTALLLTCAVISSCGLNGSYPTVGGRGSDAGEDTVRGTKLGSGLDLGDQHGTNNFDQTKRISRQPGWPSTWASRLGWAGFGFGFAGLGSNAVSGLREMVRGIPFNNLSCYAGSSSDTAWSRFRLAGSLLAGAGAVWQGRHLLQQWEAHQRCTRDIRLMQKASDYALIHANSKGYAESTEQFLLSVKTDGITMLELRCADFHALDDQAATR